jgi:hypothetical protein
MANFGNMLARAGLAYFREKERQRQERIEEQRYKDERSDRDAERKEAQKARDRQHWEGEEKLWWEAGLNADDPAEAEQAEKMVNEARASHPDKKPPVPQGYFMQAAQQRRMAQTWAMAQKAKEMAGGNPYMAEVFLHQLQQAGLNPDMSQSSPQAMPMGQQAPAGVVPPASMDIAEAIAAARPRAPQAAPQMAMPQAMPQAMDQPEPGAFGGRKQAPRQPSPEQMVGFAPPPSGQLSIVDEAANQVQDKSYLPIGLLPKTPGPDYSQIMAAVGQERGAPATSPAASAPAAAKRSPFVDWMIGPSPEETEKRNRDSAADLLEGIKAGLPPAVQKALDKRRAGETLTEEDWNAIGNAAREYSDWRGALTTQRMASAENMAMRTKHIPKEFQLKEEELRLKVQQARSDDEYRNAVLEAKKFNDAARLRFQAMAASFRERRAATEDIQWAEEMARDYDVLAQRAGPRTDEFGMTVPGDPEAQARYRAQAESYRARGGGATGGDSDLDYVKRIRAYHPKLQLQDDAMDKELRKQGVTDPAERRRRRAAHWRTVLK